MTIHEQLVEITLLSTVKYYTNREKVTDSLLPTLSKQIFETIRSESYRNNPNLSLKKLESIIFNNDIHPKDLKEFDGRQWRNYANKGRTLKPTTAREYIARAVEKYLINGDIGLSYWYLIDVCESASRTIREFSKPNETILFNKRTQELMHNSMLKHYDEIQIENKAKYDFKGNPHTSSFIKKACMIGSEIAFIFSSLTSNIEDFKNPEFIGNVLVNTMLADQNIDK
jgi:hypothetical protein